MSTTDLVYQILIGGTINGSYGNFPTSTTIIPDTEMALLVNTTCTTISNGKTVFQGISSGNNDLSKVLAVTDLLNFTLPINQNITLAVARIGSNSSNTVNSVIRVTESW